VKEFSAWLEGNDNVKPAAEISRQEVEHYLEWCYYKGNSNQTRHTKLTALGKFFRYLRYENTVKEDITANIPKPKIFSRRMQTYTKEDVLNIFKAISIETEKGLRDCCIFILASFCGLRISEIYKLRLADIIDNSGDLDIAIPEDIGKKHSSRTIYLWKAPAFYIRSYLNVRISQGAKENDRFLVSYRFRRPSGRPLDAGALNEMLKKYAARAGIRKSRVTWHMFRATHANDLQHIEGYTLPAIQERLGWKDLSTAGRYLVRRERIHKNYKSLHAYWIDFTKVWTKGGSDGNNSSDGQSHNTAAGSGGHGGNAIEQSG